MTEATITHGTSSDGTQWVEVEARGMVHTAYRYRTMPEALLFRRQRAAPDASPVDIARALVRVLGLHRRVSVDERMDAIEGLERWHEGAGLAFDPCGWARPLRSGEGQGVWHPVSHRDAWTIWACPRACAWPVGIREGADGMMEFRFLSWD